MVCNIFETSGFITKPHNFHQNDTSDKDDCAVVVWEGGKTMIEVTDRKCTAVIGANDI